MLVSIPSTISDQRRLSWIMLGKDNIFSVHTTFHFPTVEDKGRLHVYHNKIMIDHCRDNPFQARLSEIAINRDQAWFRYNWLGLFICWIGHNYPVPSSLPHTLRSGAHWPNGMELFTPAPLETNSYWLFDEQSVIQRLFIISLLNGDLVISFEAGSATFHLRTAPQHFISLNVQDLYRNGCYYTCIYNGLFYEQLGHIMIYFNWH